MLWWIIILVSTVFISFIGLIVHRTGTHADNKHPEAPSLRKAFNQNGSYEIWQEKIDKNTFHHIVDMGNGLFGDYIVYQDDCGTMYEKTIFCPKNGTLESIRKYLKTKAIRRM